MTASREPTSSAPKTRETRRELARERAATYWQSIANGLREIITPDHQINPEATHHVLGDMRGLLDQLPNLPRNARQKIYKGFKNLRETPETKALIDSELREIFIQELRLSSGFSQRQLNLHLAQQLGYLGNWYGAGADIEISRLLEAPSKKRRAIGKAALGTAITAAVATPLVVAWELGDIVEGAAQAPQTRTDTGPDFSRVVTTRTPRPAPSPTRQVTMTTATAVTTQLETPTPNPALSPAASPSIARSPEVTKPPTPTATPEPTATPTPEPGAKELETLGEKNASEYFLGGLVDIFKQRGIDLANAEPAYKERINPEYLHSDNITTLVLVTDETRERYKEFNGRGWGRADVVMILSFNPRTLKSFIMSIPRDLFAPELLDFKYDEGGAKINNGTQTGYIRARNFQDEEFDSIALMRRIAEDATGLRIDMTVQLNLDFIQGHGYIYTREGELVSGEGQSIFDAVFPEGLEINAEKVFDPKFPTANYNHEVVDIKPGKQIMRGEDIKRYTRSRHSADSDIGRSRRQRQVAGEAGKQLAKNIITDLANPLAKPTANLDNLLAALKTQQQNNNLLSDDDVSVVNILEAIRDEISRLSRTKSGIELLAALYNNSKDQLEDLSAHRDAYTKELGLSLAHGIISADPSETNYRPAMLKVSGNRLTSNRTRLGNELVYWDRIRKLVRSTWAP